MKKAGKFAALIDDDNDEQTSPSSGVSTHASSSSGVSSSSASSGALASSSAAECALGKNGLHLRVSSGADLTGDCAQTALASSTELLVAAGCGCSSSWNWDTLSRLLFSVRMGEVVYRVFHCGRLWWDRHIRCGWCTRVFGICACVGSSRRLFTWRCIRSAGDCFALCVHDLHVFVGMCALNRILFVRCAHT